MDDLSMVCHSNDRRSALVLAAAAVCVLAAGCGDARGPLGPGDLPGPQLVVVSGTVYEHGPFGQRPVAGVPLHVTPDGQPVPAATTGTDGRYHLTAPLGVSLMVRAIGGGHQQPCYAGADLAGDTVIDVHLVPNAVLAASGLPASFPVVGPRLSGRVLDVSNGEGVPIAGAVVTGTLQRERMWGASVFTRTDRDGRYLLCGRADRIEVQVTDVGFYNFDLVTIDLTEAPAVVMDFLIARLD